MAGVKTARLKREPEKQPWECELCWFCETFHPGTATGTCPEWTDFRRKIDIAYQKYVIGSETKRARERRARALGRSIRMRRARALTLQGTPPAYVVEQAVS